MAVLNELKSGEYNQVDKDHGVEDSKHFVNKLSIFLFFAVEFAKVSLPLFDILVSLIDVRFDVVDEELMHSDSIHCLVVHF